MSTVHPLGERKSARSRAAIPPDVLEALSLGEIETGNLVEGLALDFRVLLSTAFPSIIGLREVGTEVPYTHRLKQSARLVWEQFGADGFSQCLTHRSDTLRGVAAYIVPLMGPRDSHAVLATVRPLADDLHFGVREWAWLGIRPLIVENIPEYLRALRSWVAEESAYLRRFVTEATRPRGVWCAHIRELRDRPEMATDLLEPLSRDPEKYVQDSVANWLNDASKTRPEWVMDVTERWLANRPTEGTIRIVRRARRSISRL